MELKTNDKGTCVSEQNRSAQNGTVAANGTQPDKLYIFKASENFRSKLNTKTAEKKQNPFM